LKPVGSAPNNFSAVANMTQAYNTSFIIHRSPQNEERLLGYWEFLYDHTPSFLGIHIDKQAFKLRLLVEKVQRFPPAAVMAAKVVDLADLLFSADLLVLCTSSDS
jgi:hypothetical protein